jgi:hypothetical protein
MDAERAEVERLMAEWRAVEAEATAKVAGIKRRLAHILGLATGAMSPAPKENGSAGEPKGAAAAPKWRAVIDTLGVIGEVDAATILEMVKPEGEGSRADKLKLIRSQFNYLEKHKHYIEKIETKRGWWRLTAAGRAVVDGKGVAH